MAYDAQVIRAARERLEQRRAEAEAEAAARRETYTARFPRLREIEREMASALPEITRVIIDGGDEAAIQTVREKNLALQGEMGDILAAAGCDFRSFAPPYTCPRCADTGYKDGQICACYRQLLREEACRQLSSLSAMKLTDFDAMDVRYYDDTVDPKLGESPRARMARIIDYGKAFAGRFTGEGDGLLLFGPTGTGKTHLSLAIAKAVTEKGYGVIYGSAGKFFRRMENEHFGRAEGDTEAQLAACDLLILDDLGMEPDTPFYRSVLYTVLNDRLLENRPTVISTNLGLAALKERYGDQIVSRIIGSLQPLAFAGKDIRQILRRQSIG